MALTTTVMWIIVAIGFHIVDYAMRTVQMTLDDELVREVDRVAKRLHTNRSAFTRDALRAALARHHVEQMEGEHRQGYERFPVAADEFSLWEDEQAWGDA